MALTYKVGDKFKDKDGVIFTITKINDSSYRLVGGGMKLYYITPARLAEEFKPFVTVLGCGTNK